MYIWIVYYDVFVVSSIYVTASSDTKCFRCILYCTNIISHNPCSVWSQVKLCRLWLVMNGWLSGLISTSESKQVLIATGVNHVPMIMQIVRIYASIIYHVLHNRQTTTTENFPLNHGTMFTFAITLFLHCDCSFN